MPNMETKTTAGRVEAKQLIFRLAGEEFGVPVLKVQEIIQWMEVTRVPRVPVFIQGVINLRGRVVPVIDLRQRFGLPPQAPTPHTCIVVLQIGRESGAVTAGAVVDEVLEVLDLPAEAVSPPPELGTGVDGAFISGIGQAAHRVIMLLNVEKILDSREWISVDKIANAEKEQAHE